MYEIMDKQKEIVKKFKVKGIYLKTKYFTKTFNKIMINQSKLGSFVIFYLTNNLPCYKYENKDIFIFGKDYIGEETGYNEIEFNKLNNV